MRTARIVIGANYGDEGKGTVVAHYAKQSDNTLNILTNGGAQRGHSIMTEVNGNIESHTFQHFGAGTYHGADNYYSPCFILNPMQFVKEYDELLIKPKTMLRDKNCRWTTPYDMMVNHITEELQGRHASCRMGIWNTVKRYKNRVYIQLDDFTKENYVFWLDNIKRYYEKFLTIPQEWKKIWDSETLKTHFFNDCEFLKEHVGTTLLSELDYDNYIFENGQGLLLDDTGHDTFDTTPSRTGRFWNELMLMNIPNVDEITTHYVTRPYVTRHGDGYLEKETTRHDISLSIQEDRTNHYNEGQGKFRYGTLDLESLKERIEKDSCTPYTLEITHCDEMDRLPEFKKLFNNIKTYDNPIV